MSYDNLISIKQEIKNIKEPSDLQNTYVKLKNNNPDLINNINLFFSKYHNCIPEINETTEMKEERLKRQDTEYCNKIIKRYDSKCAITGKDYNLGNSLS